MAKMKGIRVTRLTMIMMAVMAILVSPGHAQVQNFDGSCFLRCAAGCLSNPTLQCLFNCLSSCIAPSPSPSPSPPNPPMPPMPPLPPLPPKPPMPPLPPMPPNPPATPPTSPVLVPMPSPAGLKSCNFKCAIQDCTSIETDMEKLNCMGNCFKSACEDN